MEESYPGRSQGRGRTSEDADDAGASRVLLWVHVHLRGKYWILILLASVFAGGLGYFGYRLGAPTYRSVAYIQVVRPPIKMIRIDDVTDDLEAFVAAQIALLKGGRVAASAVANPDWQQAKRGSGLDQADEFSLAVNVAAKDRILTVSFDDGDPRVAAAGLKALLAEYKVQYEQQERDANDARTRPLTDREAAANNEANMYQGEINDIAKAYGTDDLSGLYAQRAAEAERIDVLVRDLAAQLKPSTRPVEETAGDTKGLEAAVLAMDIEELAQRDTVLRELLTEKLRAERELRSLIDVRKYGQTHPSVEHQRGVIKQIGTEINLRSEKVRGWLKRQRPTVVATSDVSTRLAMLNERRKEEWERAYGYGVDNQRLKVLRGKLETARQKAADFRHRVDQINIETTNANRVVVPTEGTVPSKPATDTRPRFAALGVTLGLMLAVGLVLLPAILDVRFRSADHTRVTRSLGPVMGVLPELPEQLADENATAIAAHSVHRTRTSLQSLHRGRPGGQVLAVTSSQAGTGKTSVTLALGVSYATSGSRTLMIDCDLVGGGLSSRVGSMMRRRIGEILTGEGLITGDQLAEAILKSAEHGRRLGEVCVELGYVEKGDVERAINRDGLTGRGILNALDGEGLETCTTQTGYPGLEILSLGAADPADSASISPVKFERMVREARGQYDAVIVDTGPVPGSLEASVVAPHVDGVVMVVARGERRPTVTRSMEFLREMGADVVGVVFNRAQAGEVEEGSSAYRRTSSGSRLSVSRASSVSRGNRSEELVPVARAVAGVTVDARERRGEG